MKAILKIDNKEIEVEISEEQIEKLTEKKKSPFERVSDGDDYYCIDSLGMLDNHMEDNDEFDAKLYKVGNYCTDKDLIQQQAYRETLNRLLWRWQHENDEPVDWESHNGCGFCICGKEKYNFHACVNGYKQQGTVYFSTQKKAKQAIKEVVKPFMAEHPDFVW